MGDTFVTEQITIDQGLIADAKKDLTPTEREMVQVLVEEYQSGHVILSVEEMTKEEYDQMFQPFGKRSLKNSSKEVYFANRFTNFKMNVIKDEDFDAFSTGKLTWADIIDTSDRYGPTDLHPGLLFSCMAKIILKVYKASHDNYKTVYCKNPKDELTLEKIYKICYGKEWTATSDIILTPEEAQPFFDKFYLQLEIYSARCELLNVPVIPPKQHSHIKPAILRLMYQDEHVEEMTELKSFIGCMTNGTLESQRSLSSNVRIPGKSKLLGKEFKLASSSVEVLKLIFGAVKALEELPIVAKEGEPPAFIDGDEEECQARCLNVIFNGSLNQLLLQHIMPMGLVPLISTQLQATVTGIYLPNLKTPSGKSFKISINNPCNIIGFGRDMMVDSVEQYTTFVKAEEKFQRLLMNKKTLSHFTTQVKYAFDEYCVNIPYGRVGEESSSEEQDLKCHMIDFCKQYASCLVQSSDKYGLPVVSIFEQFQQYKGAPVKANLLYIVKILKHHPVYNKRHTLMFGFELIEVLKWSEIIPVQIVQVLNLIWVPVKGISTFIKELFDPKNPMDDMFKKAIPNKAIGMCGKRENKIKDVQLFKNKDDAIMHLQKHGGHLTELGPHSGVYALHKHQKMDLTNGFRPIREMVLSTARLNMMQLYVDLMVKAEGCIITGLKTDAIFFQPPPDFIDFRDVPCIKDLLTNKLGGARLEFEKVPPAKEVYMVEKSAPLPRVINFDNTYCVPKRPTSVKNEFSLKSVHECLGDKSFLSCLGGHGKSHAAITYQIMSWANKEAILVVTPFNSIAHNVCKKYGVPTCTFHAFIGEGHDGAHVKPFNLEGIKGIVFDEILLLSHAQLTKLYMWSEEVDKTYEVCDGPDPKQFPNEEGHYEIYNGEWVRKYEVLATGDPMQLEAIDDVINNARKIEYVKQLFPNVFTLNYNWRLKTDADRKRMAQLEKSLFALKSKKEIAGWVKKNFRNDKLLTNLDDVKKLGIKRAVSYFNSSGYALNLAMHSLVKDPKKGKRQLFNDLTYYMSNKLVCRKRVLIGPITLHANYEFEISGFEDATKSMKIKDVLTKEEHLVSYALIVSNFSLPYCNTVHSSQGASIDEKYVIADWGSFAVTIQWLYTAISRGTSLDDIYFLLEDLSGLSDTYLERTVKKMVKGYINQDRRRNRMTTVCPDFVDEAWIMEQYKRCGCCKGCGLHMTFETNAENKVTVNRLDNTLAHVKGNCELMCKACNVRAK